MQRSRLLVTVRAKHGLRQATGSLIMTLGKIMSTGWSPSDKTVAQKAYVKAKSAAEAEAIRVHREKKIERIEDLWGLELQIREWRRERQHVFTLNYDSAEESISEWIRKGWISKDDISGFSEQRLARIIQNKK